MFIPLPVFADESCLNLLEKHSLNIGNTESNCLWNKDHTAVAICSNEQTTKCYIVDPKNATDVSRIQQSNIGKLGIAKEVEYEPIKTTPKEWLSSKQNQYLVLFQTKAWLKGQRYTISGPVAITNGNYHAQ